MSNNQQTLEALKSRHRHMQEECEHGYKRIECWACLPKAATAARQEAESMQPPAQQPRYNTIDGTSQRALVMQALIESGRKEFTREDLVVVAWEDNKKTFGLRGYEDLYPNSLKVLAMVDGEKGLAKTGFLRKKDGIYRLVKEDGVHEPIKGATGQERP